MLIEKEKELGGNLRKIFYLLNGGNPQRELDSIIKKVISNSKIKLFTETKIKSVSGSVGNFKTVVEKSGYNYEFEHGVVIIATGATEYKPTEYLYGKDIRVMTQSELEGKIGRGEQLQADTVVMIQCVGSRNNERQYCSRICCSEAIKNALRLKSISPNTEIYILYRDIRTYGFKERYYTEARKKGVKFIRYDENNKPEVTKENNKLLVRVKDSILNIPVEIPADAVVLSTGIVPREDNKEVAQHFKIPLTQDGFFLEAHMKLRPVDFATDGVFVCGLSHFPKLIEESIIQAQASSARAQTILSKDRIELEANISNVVDENCDGCAYCVEPCPYKAITLLEYVWKDSIKKVVEVNESICKGCGTCMATCPKKGTYVKGFTLEQIGAQVDAALEALQG